MLRLFLFVPTANLDRLTYPPLAPFRSLSDPLFHKRGAERRLLSSERRSTSYKRHQISIPALLISF